MPQPFTNETKYFDLHTRGIGYGQGDFGGTTASADLRQAGHLRRPCTFRSPTR